jgi:uncharacterized membrane protein YcaP (DUF421 family)
MSLFSGVTAAQLAETAVRSAVVYLTMYAALRLAGKRHAAQLTIADLVLMLLVSNAVQNAMVGNDTTLAGGLVAGLTLIGINLVLTRLVLRSRRLGKLLTGQPTLLVYNGEIVEGHCAREGVRTEDLEAAIREHGLENASQVKSAVLEIDGSISVVPFSEAAKEGRLRPVHSYRRRGGRRPVLRGPT